MNLVKSSGVNMSTRTYATVSIYSSTGEALAPIKTHMATAPSRQSSKNGIFGLHYSTRDELSSSRVEDHLEKLMLDLHNLPGFVGEYGSKDLGSAAFEVRLWIYFESARDNEDFSLPSGMINWLQSVGGDVCVDVWRGNAQQ